MAERAAAEEVAAKAAAEAEAAAKAAAEAAAEAAEKGEKEEEIEIEEGETLEEIKARMSSLKPKKPTISADMLNTANTYDDKVALIRMIVSEDAARARVAGVLKNMIQSG
jgi:flagellar M-ring protein FliF